MSRRDAPRAVDKFSIGDHVRMTAKAVEQGLDGLLHNQSGTVAGFPVQGIGDISKLVYVTRKGNKTKQSYHMDFWEVDSETGAI